MKQNEVCLVNTVVSFRDGKGWQLMKRVRCGLVHVTPGVMYTLADAINVCNINNYRIIAVGDFWQCLE